MDPQFIIVLSDIHIGTDRPTNWFQSSAHAGYLGAALDFLIQYYDELSEIVILGDFVDFWTYQPTDTIPLFADILNTKGNAPLFQKFQALLDLVPKISFVNGNHDMTLTQNDLNALKGPKTGRTMTLQSAPYLPLGNGDLVLAHGHEFSMMCAPYNDSKNPISPLPIGYYATRAGAYYAYLQVQANNVQNVAQLPGTGEPTGTSITTEDAVLIIAESAVESVGYGIMSAIQAATGLDWYAPITLPDGSTRSLDQADEDFDNLFDSFKNRTGPDGQTLGYSGAAEALLFPDVDNDLSTYATQLAEVNQAKVVVFGHTHVPLENQALRVLSMNGGATPTTFVYANSGFNCPSLPDIADSGSAPTFVSIGLDDSGAHPESIEHLPVLRASDGSYEVGNGLMGVYFLSGATAGSKRTLGRRGPVKAYRA